MTTEETIAALDRGELRVAEKIDGEWRVNEGAKAAILDYFRIRKLEPIEVGPLDVKPCQVTGIVVQVKPRTIALSGISTVRLKCGAIRGRQPSIASLR